MSDVGDELRVLRERAYGPAPDIHLDPEAAARLRQLEGKPLVQVGNGSTTTVSDASVDITISSAIGVNEVSRPPDGEGSVSNGKRGRLAPRRSTVLVMLGVVLFAVAVVVTLIVVQRVQTDPLQTGAVQVARLPVDPSFQVPDLISGAGDGGAEAYQDFYGVRAFVVRAGDSGFVASSDADPGAECMVVYQPDQVTITGDGYSYSGQLFATSCAAGVFPPAITFTVNQSSPDSLQAAFTPDTALQFVYDHTTKEIVVFQG